MIVETDVLSARRTGTTLRRAVRSPRWARLLRPNVLLVLLVLAGIIPFLVVTLSGSFEWPLSGFVPIVVVGALFLGPGRSLVLFGCVFVLDVIGTMHSHLPWRTALVAVLAHVLVMAIMFWVCMSRDRLGLPGIGGHQMLFDLRERLARGGDLPELPEGWVAESTVVSAQGDAFSGDFVLANCSGDGTRLEVAIVDVSGKGHRSGSRALLLSGAFGGLLGSVAPEEFLPAANAYLLRQNWNEGFATCLHIAVDLRTGDYTIGSAGHPPAAVHSQGSGLWSLHDALSGPLLGVIDGAVYPRNVGRMEWGDMLLGYTDGVIESRGHGLHEGIDRMLGTAERHGSCARGLAEALCRAARSGDSDDRAAVVIARQ